MVSSENRDGARDRGNSRPHACLRAGAVAAICERIEQANPRFAVLCGRGSSGHVTVFMRYLFEARLGLLVSAAAPSVVTAYKSPPDMRDTLLDCGYLNPDEAPTWWPHANGRGKQAR